VKTLYRLNLFARLTALVLSAAFFQYLCFAFIWHSLYWGTVTFVLLLWLAFIIISPLLGRIGCGWVCFIGTLQDLMTQYAVIHVKRHRPMRILRITTAVLFLASVAPFMYLNVQRGLIAGVRFNLFLFSPGLASHYVFVWLADCMGAILLGVFLHKRWACKNLCIMGSLCAIGSKHSRLLVVVDPWRCKKCGLCEKDCPTDVAILQYVERSGGLVADSECLMCGRCIDSCKWNAIHVRMLWSRSAYMPAMRQRNIT
jgi:ferredoxin-type protein NapH